MDKDIIISLLREIESKTASRAEGARLLNEVQKIESATDHPDTTIQETAAASILKSGSLGISSLMDVMEGNDVDAIRLAAEILMQVPAEQFKSNKKYVIQIVRALTLTDRATPLTIINLLNILSAFNSHAEGYEENIAVLLHSGNHAVRKAARNCLASIDTLKAKSLLMIVVPRSYESYISEETGAMTRQ